MKKYISISFLSIFLMLFSIQAFSQASLAAENIIDDIKVVTKYGKQKVYTVFRDAKLANQWYYMPNELRIAEEIDVKGKVKPKMTILRYQYSDAITKEVKEGGILVAAFTYAIEPEVVESVKKQILTKRKGLSAITLSAIPLNTSTIDFLADNKEFIGNLDAKPTMAINGATSASQEMVLSFNLTVLGASVFKALASGSGIPVRGNITYNGLTAPCGYKINGSWNNIYEYFEKQTKIEGKLGWKWLKLGGNYSREERNEKIQNFKEMKINVIECPSSNPSKEGDSSINNTEDGLSEIVKSIQKEVLSDTFMNRASELEKLTALLSSPSVKEDKQATEKITKAIDELTKILAIGAQRSVKSTKQRRSGAINYDFSRQRLIIRSTTFGGLLSFSKYGLTEERLLKEGYIIDVDVNRDFPSVIIGLPNINPDFNLKTVTLEVSYKNSKGETHSEARSWDTSKNGWVTPTNKDVGFIRFNLIGETNKQKAQEPEFDVKMQVVGIKPEASFVVQKKIKLSSGERYMDAIEFLTSPLIIDASLLDYAIVTNNNSDLEYTKLIFSKGNVTMNRDIKAFIKDGNAGAPNPIQILLPNDEAPLKAKVSFKRKNSAILIERQIALELGENTLSNTDWKDINN